MLATHSDIMFQHGAHGDKDQFRLAFALSGNPDSYYQVCQLISVQLHLNVHAECGMHKTTEGMCKAQPTLIAHSIQVAASTEAISAEELTECNVVEAVQSLAGAWWACGWSASTWRPDYEGALLGTFMSVVPTQPVQARTLL